MDSKDKLALIMYVFQAIFASKAANSDVALVKIQTNTGLWGGRWFKNSATGQKTLRGFDFSVQDGNQIKKLRMLEQNPDKTDNFGNLKQYAVLARQGHQIAWLIDATQGGSFLGRIQDGKWVPSAPQVIDTMASAAELAQNMPMPGSTTTYTEEQPNPDDIINDVPDIPEGRDIPEWLLEAVANDQDVPEWDD